MNTTIIIDAKDSILGRIASYAAKQALFGKNIVVVNCNDALITGNKASIIAKYKQARARGSAIQKGPNFPRIPERIVKRTIRGMLAYKLGRGAQAFDKIRCYNTVPKEFESQKKISLITPIKTKTIKLSDVGAWV